MGRRQETCPSCGQPGPSGASFCPSCGAPSSGVVFERAEPTERGGEVVLDGGGRGRWRSVIIGGGVAAALVGAAVFVGTNGNGGTSAPTTSPTTVPSTAPAPTAATTAAPTTTALPAYVAGTGPVLAASTSGTLWAIVHRDGGGNDVVTIDLATGDVRRQPSQVGVSGLSRFLATPGGALVLSGAGGSWINRDLVETETSQLLNVDEAVASPLVDEAWGLSYSSGSGPPVLVHLRPSTGEVLATIRLPDKYSSLVGVDPAGEPVVTGIGGSYVLEPATGTWRRLSNSFVYAVAHGRVVEHVCDESFVCVDQVRDLNSGDHHALEGIEGSPYFAEVTVAPVGGAVAAVVSTNGSNVVSIVVWDGQGQVMAQRPNVDVAGPTAAAAFTPDGAYVVYLDRGDVRLISVDGPAGISPAAVESQLNDTFGGAVAVSAVASAG